MVESLRGALRCSTITQHRRGNSGHPERTWFDGRNSTSMCGGDCIMVCEGGGVEGGISRRNSGLPRGRPARHSRKGSMDCRYSLTSWCDVTLQPTTSPRGGRRYGV